MLTSKVIYLGDLRTESTHLRSGVKIISDAPVDNQGKGEAFSPTDLVATATATCMLTLMGISARTHGLQIEGAEIDVTKIMASNPRRIAEIHCYVRVPDHGLSPQNKKALELAATTCPVILSLSDDIKKVIEFEYRA